MSSLQRRDAACLWHPYTQHGVDRDPLPVVSARGSILKLQDGRELIDAISSWWACLHGHGHPALIEAMRNQARELDHVLFAGATHEPAIVLAEELLDAAPKGLSRVFYTDDGSTAVEVALKMVYHAWIHRGEEQRKTFLALEGAYHGDTFGAMSVGDPKPFFDAYRPLLFDVRRIPAEPRALQEALDELQSSCAGLIIEPLIQGAAGMRMHGIDFVREARRLCTEHEVPLIADEVLTGFGRTGSMFACEKAGITPDVMCLAKGLTGGMFPLAATLTTEALFEAFVSDDRSGFLPHGHTMTASPIGCAVALASLRLGAQTRVHERLAAIGERIEEGLAPLRDDPRVRNLRRLGGIVAMDLTPSTDDDDGYLSSLAPRIRAEAIEQGVLLRPLGNVLYAMPPACVQEAQLELIITAMRRIVELVDA